MPNTATSEALSAERAAKMLAHPAVQALDGRERQAAERIAVLVREAGWEGRHHARSLAMAFIAGYSEDPSSDTIGLFLAIEQAL